MNKHFPGDTTVLLGRSLRHVTRSPDTIITTAVMPIAMMLMFVYVFGGAIDTGSDSYVTYLLPGILLITVASGISYTAFRLFMDMKGGIVERFRSMPIARSSVLWAHVLTSLVANLVSLAVVVLVAVLMGFRSGAGVLTWLAVADILVLFTLALTWLAVIPGLTARSVDGASAFSYPLIFLPFLSSAFVPTDTMPGPVRAFAENQPVTSIVDTIRRLFARQPVGTGIWVALAWCLGILAVAYVLAMTTYRRKTAWRERPGRKPLLSGRPEGDEPGRGPREPASADAPPRL
ncbi:ABC transporter permease [Actinophytocola oryzae]|uniref:Transport permease protein n=1 Tax=Actinophytocola oryzae TaxID=502181 RepID=A0A4R7W3Z1_9PSEU|nr:ABC transporter permease [Actinophytocola oryzae]TDV56327.1 ABC-2 type transport system permease protein [Actinophytocola oryzae]